MKASNKHFSFLNEEVVKLPYGCLMVTFALPKWNWFVEKLIDPEDYAPQKWMDYKATYEEMHVTVLYGFESEVTLDQIQPLLLPLEEINVDFTGIDHFSSKEYDVVKFNCESEQLRALNKVVSTLPNKQSYPEYKPHATIGYVKSGLGEKYNRAIKPFTLKPDGYLFSSPNGSTTSFIV